MLYQSAKTLRGVTATPSRCRDAAWCAWRCTEFARSLAVPWSFVNLNLLIFPLMFDPVHLKFVVTHLKLL